MDQSFYEVIAQLLRISSLSYSDKTRKDYNELAYLIEKYKKIDIRNERGETALILSICDKNLELVKIIIKAGANINLRNIKKDNITPLMVAASESTLNIIKLLIESGADISSKTTCSNKNALLFACETGNKDTLKYLLDIGIDPNSLNYLGFSAIEIAILNGYEEIVQLLLNANADVNLVENEDSDSCLIMAAEKGNITIAKLLINAGADVNSVGEFGHNALMRAILWRYFSYRHTQTIYHLVSMLIEAGINVNARTPGICTFTNERIDSNSVFTSLINTYDYHSKDDNRIKMDKGLIHLLLNVGAKIKKTDLQYAEKKRDRILLDSLKEWKK